MKKNKLLKEIAYLSAPEMGNGFLPPTGYDYKMSVSLIDLSIKIYGFTGTEWEVIHNTDGQLDSFTAEISHQKYYFESKSGKEETVRVMFLSSEDEVSVLTQSYGVSGATRKFHHINEVPVYRGSDQGKMLTVMSDGSLRWLGLNESYIIEAGGEQQPPQQPEQPSATFIGESQVVSDNLQSVNANITDGIFNRTVGDDDNAMTYISLKDDGIIQYDEVTNDRIHSDTTISFWVKSDRDAAYTGESIELGNYGSGSAWSFIKVYTYNGKWTLQLRTGSSAKQKVFYSSRVYWPVGDWVHLAITYKDNGDGSYTGTFYLNGVEFNSFSDTKKFFGNSSTQKFGIGNHFKSDDTTIGTTASWLGSIDSLQIGDGVALTAEQVALIAGQSDRKMMIEAAAAPQQP